LRAEPSLMSSFTSHTRAPVAAAVVCLAVGMLAGAWDARLGARALEHARAAQVLSEVALLVCLFCTGLRLSAPLNLTAWRVPLRLAAVTLPATVVLVAVAANAFFGLPFAPALLLGAILGPTDPVLASDLKLSSAHREETLRFALTAEGALSSSLALPLVLLALGLAGQHDLGPLALHWVAFDLLWALAGGALLGWFVGALAAHGLARLESRGAVGELGLTELMLLASVVAFTYGASVLLHANGFLGVLAAGSSLARGGAVAMRSGVPWRRVVVTPRLTRALSCAAARIERLAELAIVIVLGALLTVSSVRPVLILFALVVLVAVRPVAARLGLGRAGAGDPERHLIAWFGIRGVASMYYAMFAVDEGLSTPVATQITAVTLAVLATSIALHALTALPLANKPAAQRS
jgi:sodium/hydrogen antiporter